MGDGDFLWWGPHERGDLVRSQGSAARYESREAAIHVADQVKHWPLCPGRTADYEIVEIPPPPPHGDAARARAESADSL
jgi:hypothetical protein